jgi:hypothetical protein
VNEAIFVCVSSSRILWIWKFTFRSSQLLGSDWLSILQQESTPLAINESRIFLKVESQFRILEVPNLSPAQLLIMTEVVRFEVLTAVLMKIAIFRDKYGLHSAYNPQYGNFHD